MKKVINILLYATFFGLVLVPQALKSYISVHLEAFQYAVYILPAVVILGTLILLIRPKLVPDHPSCWDLLLQGFFIAVNLALFIWQYNRITYHVLVLLTEDVYLLIVLLQRKHRDKVSQAA